jgi:hypothetical protein
MVPPWCNAPNPRTTGTGPRDPPRLEATRLSCPVTIERPLVIIERPQPPPRDPLPFGGDARGTCLPLDHHPLVRNPSDTQDRLRLRTPELSSRA